MLTTYILLLKIILSIHGETLKCGVNWIRNSDAEAKGLGTKCDKSGCPAGWNCIGSVTQHKYKKPTSPRKSHKLNTPGPPDRGRCYFFGGTDPDTSMTQKINLTSYMHLIDSQETSFYLSAWLGGYLNQKDQSTVSIEFRNCASQVIGNKIMIGPVTPSDRNKKTAFVFRNTTGVIPVGSRWMVITVRMIKKSKPEKNDGSADNIHFEIRCSNQTNNSSKEKQQTTIIISYNQSTFDSCAIWNLQPTTFLNLSTGHFQVAGLNAFSSSISHDSFMKSNALLVRNEENMTLTRNHSVQLNDSKVYFIRTNGDIHSSESGFNQLLQIYTKATISPSCIDILSVISECTSIFTDHMNQLYCSRKEKHQVAIIEIRGELNIKRRIGNGNRGSTSFLLDSPIGIFVDRNSNLYVADSGNHRIQLFSQEKQNGKTIVGNLPSNGLRFPTRIVVDTNGNLFIADSGNHRIVMSTEHSIRCIVGCSATNRVQHPEALWFDHVGNLFVLCNEKKQIQKFSLITHINEKSRSCSLESTCLDPTRFGVNCSFSNTKCNISQPCQNNGTCTNTKTSLGYSCTCPPDFHGKHCEQDRRVCKPTTCLNNGTCHNISKTDFNCSCASGWEGKRCERIINLCSSSPCQNRGVCFPLLLNYTCKCLQGSYSGRHCEITTTRTKVLQIVSTSLAYIAIIAMATVVMFVLIMDILKYCFGIDPVEDERERLRRKKYAKKRKPPVIQRFTYVNK